MRARADLATVVADAVEASQPAARAAGLVLESVVPPSLVALVDAGRIRQVVDNLLSNAVKYSEPGGTVAVTLTPEADDVDLTVSDSGFGIAPADLDRLFTRFFRGEEARERHIQGTGIGLSIVRSIVEAHGGTVSLASEVGVGSVVHVRLPHVSA